MSKKKKFENDQEGHLSRTVVVRTVRICKVFAHKIEILPAVDVFVIQFQLFPV